MRELINLQQIDLINIGILTACIFILFSGLLVFIRGQENTMKTGYFLTTIPMVGWAVSMIFFRSSLQIQTAEFWLKLLYFFPPLIPISYIHLVNTFQSNQYYNWHKKIKTFAWILPLITYIGYITLSGVLFNDIQIVSGENIIYFDSFHYLLYSITIGLFWGFAFWLMYQTYKGSDEATEKKAMRLFILGTFISTVIAVVGNLVLPYFGIFYLNWFGQIGLVVMISFTFYAVINHNFLNIRLITAELFTYSLAALLLGRSLFSVSTKALVLNIAALIGTIIFGWLLIKNVEKEIKAKKEAQKLTQDLKELNQEKSRMLSIASHQFRSPLTSIEGYASMIQDGSYGEVPDYLQEPIDRILKSSQKLAHIVDDFLNISRIEDGRMDYSVKHTDLAEATKAVVEETRGSIDKQKQDLQFETDEGGGYPAKVDVGKFQQVITNLVDNAIKYTEEGSITVRVKRKHSSIIIEVKDEGIGIDPADNDKIFSQFARADEAQEVNVSGSGLGLYIARQIVEAHDGEIWATSPGRGKGSTFHVKIPAADDTDK